MIRFAKAHAYGNDFLYVEKKSVENMALDQLARELCERHTGIGADGLMIEVHPCPERALSDGAQSLTLDEFARLMKGLSAPIRSVATHATTVR